MAETANGAGEPTPMTFEKMINGDVTDASEDKKAGVDEGESEDTEGDSDSEKEESDSNGDSNSEGDSDSEIEEATEGTDDSDEGDSEETDGKKTEDSKDLEKVAKETTGKALVLKHAGKEFNIPEDAKFTFHKGDKQVSLSLKEIGNNILTRNEIAQEFTKLDRDKKTFDRDKREVTKLKIQHEEMEDGISLIKEAAQSKNIFDIAQATLSLFSRGDTKVADELLAGVVDLAGRVHEMNEDQLKSAVLSSQLTFQNTKLKKDQERATVKTKQQEQKNWLFKEIESKGIPWDEYVERYHALKELDKRKVSQGQAPNITDEMTYEQVAQQGIKFALATRVYNKVVSAISKVNPKEKNNNDLIDAVALLTEPNYPEKDIIDIVRGVLGIPQKVSKPKDSSQGASLNGNSKEPVKKIATLKKAPAGKETKKDENKDEGPVTFDKLKSKYS